jgi:hypothetical protein
MNNTIRNYLAAYNFTAFVFWILFLAFYLVSGLHLSNVNMWWLNIAQGMAVLEILHALLKWVKSPVLSTTAQVLSRLGVMLLINAYMLGYLPGPGTKQNALLLNAGICMALMAWSITEIVRYALYFAALFKRQPYWLLWLRYSFFIVLYPMGVTGEWLIFIFLIVPAGPAFNVNTALVAVIFVAYFLFFPRLYKYLWAQRKLKLQ